MTDTEKHARILIHQLDPEYLEFSDDVLAGMLMVRTGLHPARGVLIVQQVRTERAAR